MPLWGRDCPLPALAALTCLSPAGDGPILSRLALLRSVSGPGSVLGYGFWQDSYPQLGCYLQLVPSDCPQGPVLNLSNAACASLSSPCLLVVVDVSVWAASLLGVTVRHLICGFYLFIYFSSQLCCSLRFQDSPETHW